MSPAKLSKLELRLMEALWRVGPASVREIQEDLPAKRRPAYSTGSRASKPSSAAARSATPTFSKLSSPRTRHAGRSSRSSSPSSVAALSR
jgi:Penicillinase repressor